MQKKLIAVVVVAALGLVGCSQKDKNSVQKIPTVKKQIVSTLDRQDFAALDASRQLSSATSSSHDAAPSAANGMPPAKPQAPVMQPTPGATPSVPPVPPTGAEQVQHNAPALMQPTPGAAQQGAPGAQQLPSPPPPALAPHGAPRAEQMNTQVMPVAAGSRMSSPQILRPTMPKRSHVTPRTMQTWQPHSQLAPVPSFSQGQKPQPQPNSQPTTTPQSTTTPPPAPQGQ